MINYWSAFINGRVEFMLYKVVLADDEDEIRDGMAKRILWEQKGFQIVGLAKNGVEALDLVEEFRPDVIITDIQMPLLNGLDFIECALKIVPTVKVVVFSGYDNFNYAQHAIKLKVTSYLLKPFSAKDFEELLLELKSQMDSERLELSNIESLEKTYRDSLPLLKERYLSNCLLGQSVMNQDMVKASLFNLNKKARRLVSVVHLSRQLIVSKEEKIFQGKEELLPLAVKKVIESILQPYTKVDVLIIGDFLAVVIKEQEQLSISFLLSLLNEVSKELVYVTGIKYFFGLGRYYDELESLNLSYQEALQALEYSFILQDTDESAIYIHDVSNKEKNVQLSFGDTVEREFRQVVLFGDEKMISRIIDDIFSPIETNVMTFKNYHVYLIELLVSIVKLIEKEEMCQQDFFDVEVGELFSTVSVYTVGEIKERVLRVCLKLSRNRQIQTADTAKLAINEAIILVEKNYSQTDFGLEKMSDMLHLSATYFSSLFKKETGTSFISYLTDIRLTKAEELLRETNKKTYEITELIGYQEANYFSYVFKKKYGISPINYRKKIRSTF